MKKQILYPLIVIVLMLFASTAIFAQTDPNEFSNNIGDPDNMAAESVPIDDGLVVLIAAGIAFGVKKAYDHKKNSASVAQ